MMKLLRIILAGCSLVIVATVCTLTPVGAGGGPIVPILRVSPSTPSATVGGSIAFTINAYYIKCVSNANPSNVYYAGEGDGPCSTGYSQQGEMPASGYYYDPDPITIDSSGSGNTISPSSLTIDSTTGNAQFTLSSSVVESKTVTVTQHYAGYVPNFQSATTSVSFTANAPTPAPIPTHTTPTAAALPKTTAPPAPASPTPTPEAAPAAPVPSIKLGNSTLAADGTAGTKPTVQPHEPVVLSGTTVPNGVVAIYVFSTPHMYKVTAGKDGHWSYTVATSGLQAGAHHIEATVTDPATGKTSARSQVLAFTLAKAVQPLGTGTRGNGTKHSSLAVAIAIVVLAAAALGYRWRRRPPTAQQPLINQPRVKL